MRVLFRLYKRSVALLEPACRMMEKINILHEMFAWHAHARHLRYMTARKRAAAAIFRDRSLICMQLQRGRLIAIRNTIRGARRLIDTRMWPDVGEFRRLACMKPIHGCLDLPHFNDLFY